MVFSIILIRFWKRTKGQDYHSYSFTMLSRRNLYSMTFANTTLLCKNNIDKIKPTVFNGT